MILTSQAARSSWATCSPDHLRPDEEAPAHRAGARRRCAKYDEHTVGAFLDQYVLRHGVGLDGVEGLLLERAADASGGNVASTARLLGMTRPQFCLTQACHGREGG